MPGPRCVWCDNKFPHLSGHRSKIEPVEVKQNKIHLLLLPVSHGVEILVLSTFWLFLTSQSFQDVDFISSLPLLPRIKLSIFGPDNQTDFIRNIHRKQNQIGSRFFIFIFFLAVTPLVLPNKPGWWWLQASLQWFSGQQWKKFLTFTIHTVQNYRQTCTHLSYFWYLYKIIRLICPVD